MSTTLTFMELMADKIAKQHELPEQKFFEPLPIFWSIIRQLPGISFVDCGAGIGHVSAEGTMEHSIPMIAVDNAYRAGQMPHVLPINAITIGYWSKSVWPLLCRPNHDGWIARVIENAFGRGAPVLYVGLPKNYQRDIGEYQCKRIDVKVGKEGEYIYALTPRANSYGEEKAAAAADLIQPLLDLTLE